MSVSDIGSGLKVAFVGGGHPYDLYGMHEALRSLPGMTVYPQHMDDWACAGPARQKYDVVVFYHMLMDGPAAEGRWYEGKVLSALEELGQTRQGVVVLHHALLAYPKWKPWSDLVGVENRAFGYHVNQELQIKVEAPAHPIVRGLTGWTMTDETYTMTDLRPEDGNEILLTTEHPKSMKAIAWTRRCGEAKVFCFQSGHDAVTYNHPMFREVLGRGIAWAAAQTQPAEVPATMLGLWFISEGKTDIRQTPTPTCPPGHILCRTVYSGLTNGTERNVLMGGNYGQWDFPRCCGYQNVGRVVEVGVGAEGYALGDLIYSGNFSQHRLYFSVSTAQHEGNLIVKLPPQVDPQHAALFGMAGVAMHDVRRAGVKIGDKVLVVGAGCVGQLTAQAARAAGAVVTVVDLDAKRLEIARSLGAHYTVATSNEAAWDEVAKLGPFDVVFEDSGAPVLDRILGAAGKDRVIKERGKLVLIAGRFDVKYNFNAGQNAELEINHAGHFNRDDLAHLTRLVAEGLIKIGPLIQDVVPADQAVERVYDRLRDQPNRLFGTVLDWTKIS